jgi:adiponectin receptor
MSSYGNLKEETTIKKEISKVDEEEKEKKISKIKNEIIVGKYSEAPDYLKDNEYIKEGYLINCNSFDKVFRSILVCSNETINIWSHLIGCIISILLIIFITFFIKAGKIKEISQTEYESMKLKLNEIINPLINDLNKTGKENNNYINISQVLNKIKTNSENLIDNYGSKSKFISNVEHFVESNENLMGQISELSNNSEILEIIIKKWEICYNKITNYINKYIINNIKGEDIGRWPLYIMLISAFICFGFSTSFHWFSIYSKELYSFLCRLDYAGITLLIPGSCYPPYFYFYYCEKVIGTIYLTIISTFSFIVFVCTLYPGFHGPNFRRLRGSLFLILGVSTSIPILHLAFFGKYVKGFEEKPYLIFWYIGGIVYVLGGLFFVTRIPEKYIPNKFDYCFYSHNNLHICVLLAFIFHFLGAMDSFYYRQNNKCPLVF